MNLKIFSILFKNEWKIIIKTKILKLCLKRKNKVFNGKTIERCPREESTSRKHKIGKLRTWGNSFGIVPEAIVGKFTTTLIQRVPKPKTK